MTGAGPCPVPPVSIWPGLVRRLIEGTTSTPELREREERLRAEVARQQKP